jgi:serine/threonine protein kinase
MNKQVVAGTFEIQGELSKGKTGTIYHGYDLEQGRKVAVKIYDSRLNTRTLRTQAFIEKTQPLLKLNHPHLLKIYKVEADQQNMPMVFMEYFDGPSLEWIINEQGPLPLETMLILARSMTEVLVHTHFQGIIHGTLHPGHILVGPDHQIKVMDLGLAWILMEMLSQSDVDLLRPIPYLTPESARGELLTLSSDLYCLGLMMYEMVTQTTPYAGLPQTSVIGRLAYDQSDPVFDFPTSVPHTIQTLIRQMTRNKPADRLKDATHVLTIINQQLAKLNPAALKPTLPSRETEPSKPPQTEPPPVQHSEHPADHSERDIPKPLSPTAAAAPEPAAIVKPAPKEHPGSLLHHQSKEETLPQRHWKKKAGILLGLIVLMAALATGYWLIDAPESAPPVPSLSKESTEDFLQEAPSPMKAVTPQLESGPSSDSISTPQQESVPFKPSSKQAPTLPMSSPIPVTTESPPKSEQRLPASPTSPPRPQGIITPLEAEDRLEIQPETVEDSAIFDAETEILMNAVETLETDLPALQELQVYPDIPDFPEFQEFRKVHEPPPAVTSSPDSVPTTP